MLTTYLFIILVPPISISPIAFFSLSTFLDHSSQGADIVMKALRAPCRIIAENAGVEGEVRNISFYEISQWLLIYFPQLHNLSYGISITGHCPEATRAVL